MPQEDFFKQQRKNKQELRDEVKANAYRVPVEKIIQDDLEIKSRRRDSLETPEEKKQRIRSEVMASRYSVAPEDIIQDNKVKVEGADNSQSSTKPEVIPNNNEQILTTKERLNIFKGKQMLNEILKTKVEYFKSKRLSKNIETDLIESYTGDIKFILEVLETGLWYDGKSITELSEQDWETYLSNIKSTLEIGFDASKYEISAIKQIYINRREGLKK